MTHARAHDSRCRVIGKSVAVAGKSLKFWRKLRAAEYMIGPAPRAVVEGGLTREGWTVSGGCELRVYCDGLEIQPHRTGPQPTWVQLLTLPWRLVHALIPTPTARFS
jgi:hypothetical protein